ncbi:hypothetical protein PHET_01853 [Paragonimus heterotremus]|uniref:Uncharacterized protein n=1 Tax=Paragonimus heterotremus TaxID=100268 RepID=A0A8J4TR68_9TREM|nr:hypothetical protein PHET_01853 [Paragonimus heterotremus]
MSVARYPFQTGHSELLTKYPKYNFPPNQFSGSDVTVQAFQDRLNVADNFHSLVVRDISACSSRCSSPFIEAHRRDNSPSINTPSLIVIDQPAVIQTRTKSKKESCDECKAKTSLCLKRLCTFMLSHVGLAALVVVYTFIGGSAFYYMERDFEMKVQKSVMKEHEQLVQNVMNTWRESQLEVVRTLQAEFDTFIGLQASATSITLLNGASSNKPDLSKIRIKSEADRDKLIAGLKWYFAGLGWPRRILPPWWFNYTDGLAELPISTESSDQMESTSSGEYNLSDTSSERLFVMTTMKDLKALIDKVALKMQEQVERSIRKNLKAIIKAIKDDGWNGADSVDDLNWTFEGGILYAVTIITTIDLTIRLDSICPFRVVGSTSLRGTPEADQLFLAQF